MVWLKTRGKGVSNIDPWTIQRRRHTKELDIADFAPTSAWPGISSSTVQAPSERTYLVEVALLAMDH
jgi:hypothetical protein